ncbi:Crp/Fnr family transcriptional regulator [Jiella marina]|uniref:Crp/Fnr family transcriptional regulator n=1 Tax=Jiella sp. LLJ827 TaxID=2917712 RepID=UPI0021008CB0|nr:Crp/Fnr family transcriptional regulator [Jiella sp. LLJ827]MCQ0987084.1 Crp/Fnr family transcriptional regulator [Jiella sp. LLJ827]
MNAPQGIEIPEKQKLLSKCLIFQALAPEAQEDLAAHAYLRQHKSGDLIFAAGSEGQSMMAIVQGQVRIGITTPSARDVVLADLHAGDVFGEVALLDGGERSADARAMTNVTLLVLDRRDVLQNLMRHPEGALKLLELLCKRLRRSDERMAELAFLDISKRLAKALLRVIDSPASRRGPSGTRLALSQSELADMIGGSRENVNRCLKGWQKRQIIDLKDGWLIIPDPAILEAIASTE